MQTMTLNKDMSTFEATEADILNDITGPLETQGYTAANIGDIPSKTLLSIAYFFGEVIPIGRGNDHITEIRTSAEVGTRDVPLHNDKSYWRIPPRYLILYCRQASGFENNHMHVSDIHSAFLQLTEAQRTELSDRVLDIHHPSNRSSGTLKGKLVNHLNEEVFYRFRSDTIERDWEAFNTWDNLVINNLVEVPFNPGTLLIMDNWKFAHGRRLTAVENSYSRMIDRVLIM
ncbi:MAG TPA: TauD/TfdA family dioxygenase [Chitinophaga sp.]|uniref:TauD/TfdA family dioxygenase n=1 Tax=Chitinophaga sp. TaxID=1869181 RepID=UPI002CB2F9C5|nr:TauD/TfdA family dioxygenase [Chitinophaga sp.]HVI44226.1 TauD/TfdA family dioxygenase [Chitinophaga sp.]